MGSFYFINTFMKRFSQFIYEINTHITPTTRRAINKFGSNKVLKKIGKAAPKGSQSLPGPKYRTPK